MEGMDRATRVRPGEEIDTSRLRPFLEAVLGTGIDDLEVLQFPSGFSNLTYLVRADDRELVLRRPPFGTKPESGHDMGREFEVLSALHGRFPYCPKPVALCEDESVLGTPFFLMERLRGVIIRSQLPRGLELSPAEVRSLFDRVIDVHTELHAIDPVTVGLEGFGRPDGYADRQVRGWSKRYRAARTPDVPDGESVMAWLATNMPPDPDRASIVHNDFRLDNVVLDPTDGLRIVGVLDWEMATLGDPRMDLGASLAYWVEAGDPPHLQSLRMMPTHLEGAPTRREVVERYAATSGLGIDSFDFFYIYGLFRLAGIIQQIYYRSYHGQTGDERFRNLHLAVHALLATAGAVIDGTLAV
jgi:aminoglycoside phosphotransferase (APT) family kinase protein